MIQTHPWGSHLEVRVTFTDRFVSFSTTGRAPRPDNWEGGQAWQPDDPIAYRFEDLRPWCEGSLVTREVAFEQAREYWRKLRRHGFCPA